MADGENGGSVMQVLANQNSRAASGVSLRGILPSVDVHAARIKRSLSARGRRVALFVLAISLISVFDLVLTMRAHADGMLHEENPIARTVLELGPIALLVFKMSMIAGAGYVLFSLRRHRCTELACVLVLIAHFGVAVRWRICYAYYDIATVAWQDNVEYDLFNPVSVLFNCL